MIFIEAEEKQNYTLFALNVIKAKSKLIFEKNKALSCLAQSDSFFKEILDIFNELYHCEISPDCFNNILNNIELSQIDKERLLLISELYRSYVNTMEENNYKIPNYNFKKEDKNTKIQNIEIEQRKTLLKDVFNKKEVNFTSQQTNSIKYLKFSDIQNETNYVIENIKELISKNQTNFGEIGIFVDKTEARQKFLDALKAENLPVISSIYNENYEKFKNKLKNYQQISEIFLKLNMESFSYENYKNSKTESLAQKEILIEELDELLESLLYELFDDSYFVEKLKNKKESSKYSSILDVIYSQINTLKEEEKEILLKEFGMLKTFYESYTKNDFLTAIKDITNRFYTVFKEENILDIVLGKIKSISELQTLYSKILKEKPDFKSFEQVLEWLPPDTKKENNAITLASISSNQKKTFEYVFICGLTENNFPGTNSSYPFISETTNSILLQKLQEINKAFEYFIKTDSIYLAQRFNSFCEIFDATKKELKLTTHSYEMKKSVSPSMFFNIFEKYDNLNRHETIDQSETNKQDLTYLVEENRKSDACVLPKENILKLNTSAISNFQKCPRKYFYKNLLNIKETSNFSASYGTIVHSVLELLNRKFLDKYTKETTLALSEVLFNSKNESQKALEIGFSQIDIDLIQATDELSLAEMKENFKDAIDDLSYSGYFDEVPESAECEKSFSFSIDTLENVYFDGRIDAILKHNDKYHLIDYKTGKNKETILSKAISENSLNFKTEKGEEVKNIENAQNKFDYQIPLYYLATLYCKDLSIYKDKLEKLGLMYIRPKSKDNGFNEDYISPEILSEFKEKIVENLNTTIIEKIRTKTEFETKQSWNCENCSYKFLCDKGDDNE